MGLEERTQDQESTEPSLVEHLGRNEHRWARSLLSSQCFGVNLFGPLAEKPILAKRVLEALLPHRTLEKDDEVTILFEHTPKDAPEWLGEKNQPTQVDVFFMVTRKEKSIGHLLLEVKFTEHEFGSCRGAVPSTSTKPGNPDSSRCLKVHAVLESPKQMCWMAEADNGRHYWDFMLSAATPFTFTSAMACPFRQSLYQLMRNQVLAFALVQNTSADWAEFGVCLHPGNTEVRQLSDAVSGHTDALEAFNAILPNKTKIIEIHPLDLIERVRANDPSLSKWADWMLSRYDLH